MRSFLSSSSSAATGNHEQGSSANIVPDQKNNKKPPTSTAAADAGVDRYQHDLKQARAMQQQSTTTSKRQLSPSSSTSTASSRALSENDVHLAYRGLADADAQRDDGKFEEALKLYELSIELLIRYLKDLKITAPNATSSSLVDATAIEARVQNALSNAEDVKARLRRQKRWTENGQPASQPTSEGSTRFQSMSSALASALQQRTATASTRPSAKPKPQASSPSADKTMDEFSQSVLSDFLVDSGTLLHTTWDDISGLDSVKRALQETAILPLVRPDLFSGLRRPHNILLYGPPGTGKTMLVRAVAHESQSALFCVTAASLTSKWMGESEKLVRALFGMARQMAPSLIFMDEVDSLLSARKSEGEHEASRRVKTEFMVQMDGISTHVAPKEADVRQQQLHVLVLGCTNCPWDLDTAVLRRFPRRIYVPLPDLDAREALLRGLLKKAGKHSLTSRQISSVAQRLEGYSCSDISAIASEASFGPLRSIRGLDALRAVRANDVRPIALADFEAALNQASKSLTSHHLHKYDEWRRKSSN